MTKRTWTTSFALTSNHVTENGVKAAHKSVKDWQSDYERRKMSKYESMTVEKKGSVGYVFFDNPANKNRIGRKEGREMIAALQEVDQDPEVKVVILAGRGDYFCSGGKIDGFPGGKIVEQRNYADAIVDTTRAIHNMHKPIIAAVEKDAVAAGFMYMDACDIAIVGENCRFGLPEIQRGYFPMIALVALQRSVPKKRLLEMAYTGKLVDARTMDAWNLVNRVVPDGQVMAEAEAFANELAEYNPMSLQYGRDCYYACQTMNVDDAMRYADVAIVNMVNTHDAMETAYAEEQNRKAVYLGY